MHDLLFLSLFLCANKQTTSKFEHNTTKQNKIDKQINKKEEKEEKEGKRKGRKRGKTHQSKIFFKHDKLFLLFC